MYKLKVIYFDDIKMKEVTYGCDNLRDIFDYIRDCIDDMDVFEFRIYRQ